MRANKLLNEVLQNLDKFVSKVFVNDAGEPIRLTTYQKKFIEKVLRREYSKYIFISTTRGGKSTACFVTAMLLALLYDGEEVIVIAPTYKQAMITMNRIKRNLLVFKSLVEAERRDEIVLSNGSIIRCLSASAPVSMLGFGASCVIVDEAASIDNEIFRTRILRLITGERKSGLRNMMIFITTPHNIDSYVYHLWLDDDKSIYKVRASCWDALKEGRLSKDEIEFAKKMLSEKEFKCWFEAEWVSLKDDYIYPSILVNNVCVGKRMTERDDRYDYYMGVDIAQLGPDESAIVVLRVPKDIPLDDATVEMCAFYTRSQRPLNDILGWVHEMIERWKPKAVGIDSVGMGLAICDILKERFGSLVYDVALSGRERVDAYMWLRKLIEDERIILIDSDKLKAQFSSYKVKYRSDGSKTIAKTAGRRDDIVDALVYALWVIKKNLASNVYIFEEFLEWDKNNVTGGLGFWL